jgi:beta-xylosidase
MAFQDAYPLGRMPVLAPMYFNATGWPTMNFTGALTGGQWPITIASPVTNPAGSVNPGVTGTDSFSGTSLNPQWEWNHNPDTTKFTVNNGLTLKTASVSSTLYQARNTLTRRTLGPKSNATIQLQFGSMANGDIAGFALFRDYSATIAVHKTNNAYTLVQTNGIASDLNSHYFQTSAGTVEASMPLSATSIYLRATADVSPADSHIGSFSYSYDGQTFTNFGSPFTFNTTYYYFLGYRFGIFNYATSALGGSVSVPTFNLVNA